MKPTLPRRSLIRRVAVSVLAAVAMLARRSRPAVASDAEGTPTTQHRWGMTIDLDRCTGCDSCVTACRVENNVAAAGPAEEMTGAGVYWMDVLHTRGADGTIESPMPVPCMQCDDAPCVRVCPVGATYQTADGIVAQIYDRCIGCRFCQVACPYGRRFFNWAEPSWPGSQVQHVNPSVSVRPSGTVEKCNFCQHRIRDKLERSRLAGESVRDSEMQTLTACAQACPTRAITFGDLADPDSRVSRLASGPRASRLLEHLGTKPRVWYLAKDKRR